MARKSLAQLLTDEEFNALADVLLLAARRGASQANLRKIQSLFRRIVEADRAKFARLERATVESTATVLRGLLSDDGGCASYDEVQALARKCEEAIS